MSTVSEHEETKLAVSEALEHTVYTCSRVWEAWGYGTMTEEDFAPAWEDDELIESIIHEAQKPLLKQKTISTLDEIKALPIGAVLLPITYGGKAVILRTEDGTFAAAGQPRPLTPEDIYDGLHGLGAHIIHEPSDRS